MGCTSCPDAIARTIEEVLRQEKETHAIPPLPEALVADENAMCPDCGKKLRHEGGCVICDCGFSHCG